MDFRIIIPNISTLSDKKRIASQYVIDYKNLDEEALNDALIKTAPQYYNEENVKKSLSDLLFHSDRNIRILHHIILKTVLLNQDDFLMPQKDLDQSVIDFEQEIVNASNEDLQYKNKEKNQHIELFKFLLETAWERDDDITPDEKNLIEKLKSKLQITDREYHILEATIGRFPKDKNEIHLHDDIRKCRLELQSCGLLMCFRTPDKIEYDVLPREVASAIRNVWNIELKDHGYKALVNYKAVRNKQYIMDMLEKNGVYCEKYSTVEELQNLVVTHIAPSILLGGFSSRDGLDVSVLSKWCRELSLACSGQKTELIKRIIEYYDQLKETSSLVGPDGDERELLFSFFEELSKRDLEELRKQGVISKDIECERHFERATYYIFERYLDHKPQQLSGTEHADGILAYKDRLILWDNKSKEQPVNLKDHVKQFDRYIQSSQKRIAAFIVIGPDFTEESSREAMKYSISNDVPIGLLKASDLKNVALQFKKNGMNEPFPLGNFIQTGLINIEKFVF
ncbi:MAG: SAP domain-containing protein [Candidatus Hinthialibacter antarcticus]|nr:SAP domain-containing protein [Candidatus Hinthialibacter antarcticus]